MVGGIVDEVVTVDGFVYVRVVDKGEKEWRRISLTTRALCIGTGDSLWWQTQQGLWTPQASRRTKQGGDFDINVGRCVSSSDPRTKAAQPV